MSATGLMKKVKIFCMQKDEDDILNEWIIYHSSLIGINNIYIIDNNSGPVSLHILEYYKKQGLNVFNRPNYAKKGDYLCEMIREVAHDCDIAIPLDLDEFIGVVGLENFPSEIKKQWVSKCMSFDASYYGQKYPDVPPFCRSNHWSLFDHYVRCGFRENRSPCAPEHEKHCSDDECANYVNKHKRIILKTYPEYVISCNRDQIWTEINQLPKYGRYAFIHYLTSRNTELEYTLPIEEVVYFNKVDMEQFEGQGNFNKKFFDAKQLISLDHGNHYGKVDGLEKTQSYESNLCLFHYHYRGIHKLIQKCKNDIQGFGHVKDINNIRELKDKIKSEVPGTHNIITYLNYMTQGPYSLYMSESGGIEIRALSDQMKKIKATASPITEVEDHAESDDF